MNAVLEPITSSPNMNKNKDNDAQDIDHNQNVSGKFYINIAVLFSFRNTLTIDDGVQISGSLVKRPKLKAEVLVWGGSFGTKSN